MNYECYKIIVDELALKEFISFLPELEDDECYYVSLFSRKKYSDNPKIKSDKGQLKRFTGKKHDLFDKIRKLETKLGTYFHNGEIVEQGGLALYITPNPRSFREASYLTIDALNDFNRKNDFRNPHSVALNMIQVSPSRKCYFDIDIDTNEGYEMPVDTLIQKITDAGIPRVCYEIIKTRGGYHVMMKLRVIPVGLKSKWHQIFTKLRCLEFEVMMNGDNMVPCVGTYQGGSSPELILDKPISFNDLIKNEGLEFSYGNFLSNENLMKLFSSNKSNPDIILDGSVIYSYHHHQLTFFNSGEIYYDNLKSNETLILETYGDLKNALD